MDNQTKEILCIAQEECAEVSQAISKVFRFGFDSCHPKTGINNRNHLEEELGDMLAMIDIMIQKCLVSDSEVNKARINKIEKLKKWSNINLEENSNV